MTLDEIIECIKEVKEDYWEDDGYGYATADCQRITTALDEVIERLEQTRWIPVSERLPEKCGYYLCSLYYAVPPYHVFHPENDIYIHDVSVQKFDGKSFIASVKAWMPLPEPFEPQESEDKE